MRTSHFCFLALLAAGSAANAAPPSINRAVLRDAAGVRHGDAVLRQRGHDLILIVHATGLPPGSKGIHFHTIGQCAGPDFKSAGGHWNPDGHQHGIDNPAGPHMGDMPNIIIGPNGRGTAKTTIANARLCDGPSPLLDADGAALVIHAATDDMRTDPSGNSGARLVCGVIGGG